MAEVIDEDTGEVIEAVETKDPTVEEMITTFIKLRDAKKKLVKQQKEAVGKYDEMMETIGLYLKGWLGKQGANAISCDAGVAFLKGKRSATIADTGLFREYVISNNNFELADFRANVEAVAEHITEHDGEPPPGVNFTTFTAVSVNRK